MPDLTKSTGQPITMKIGKKEVVLSPVTMGDLAAFESHCKSNRLNAFLEVAKEHKMEKVDIHEGITRILSIPFSGTDFSSEMSSTTGIRFLIWRSIKHKNPEIKLQEVDDLSEIDEMMVALTAISGLGRLPSDPPEGAEEKEQTPSQTGTERLPT